MIFKALVTKNRNIIKKEWLPVGLTITFFVYTLYVYAMFFGTIAAQ